jgi:hypothetical protein
MKDGLGMDFRHYEVLEPRPEIRGNSSFVTV